MENKVITEERQKNSGILRNYFNICYYLWFHLYENGREKKLHTKVSGVFDRFFLRNFCSYWIFDTGDSRKNKSKLKK